MKNVETLYSVMVGVVAVLTMVMILEYYVNGGDNGTQD
jgi:uncharacterized membrane protein